MRLSTLGPSHQGTTDGDEGYANTAKCHLLAEVCRKENMQPAAMKRWPLSFGSFDLSSSLSC